MADVLTKQETIEQIVKEAKKLDKMELQILLTKLRVKKMQKEGIRPAADYNSRVIKAPTMTQINRWKHEFRKVICVLTGLCWIIISG